MMYKLYNFQPSGNCYKIRLVFSQLGIPYELIDVNILKQESRTTDFLTKNPNGRVPLLQHGEKLLPESNAALWYLAKGSALLPDDEFEQAQVLQWLFFEQYSHEPNIATVRYWVSILNDQEKFSQEIISKKRSGYQALDVMEQHLADRNYFVETSYSIADIALYAYTHVAHEGGFDLNTYPHIMKWLKAVESQPNHISIIDKP